MGLKFYLSNNCYLGNEHEGPLTNASFFQGRLVVHHSNDCYFCGMGVKLHRSNESYLKAGTFHHSCDCYGSEWVNNRSVAFTALYLSQGYNQEAIL